MKGKRWAAGLLAAVVIAGGAPSVSMTIALASDETPFEPIDGNAEQKRKEKEAKEALDKALAAAASVYQAGQKNYRDAEWKAFVKAYETAQGAPENAGLETLYALTEALVKAQGALNGNAVVIPSPGTVEPLIKDRYASVISTEWWSKSYDKADGRCVYGNERNKEQGAHYGNRRGKYDRSCRWRYL